MVDHLDGKYALISIEILGIFGWLISLVFYCDLLIFVAFIYAFIYALFNVILNKKTMLVYFYPCFRGSLSEALQLHTLLI